MRDVLWFMLILEAAHGLLIPQSDQLQRTTRFGVARRRSNFNFHPSSSSSTFRIDGRRRVIGLSIKKNDNSDADPQQDKRGNSNNDADNSMQSHHNKPLEEDIVKRLSLSRDRAISALSQPPIAGSHSSQQQQQNQQSPQETIARSSPLPPPSPAFSKRQKLTSSTSKQQTTTTKEQQQQQRHQRRISTRTTLKRNYKRQNQPSTSSSSSSSSLLPPPTDSYRNDESASDSSSGVTKNARRAPAKRQPYSSLLPPPLPREDYDERDSSNEDDDDDDDAMSYGLSSWEEFLGGGKKRNANKNNDSNNSVQSASPSKEWPKAVDAAPAAAAAAAATILSVGGTTNDSFLSNPAIISRLPSIRDLFPPDNIPKSTTPPVTTARSEDPTTAASSTNPSSPFDGILPVSDLFYRSSQAIMAEGDDDSSDYNEDDSQVNDDDDDDDDENGTTRKGDDEELPFSAEQSDQLTTDHNKIRIRRNIAAMSVHAKLEAAANAPSSGIISSSKRKGSIASSSSSSNSKNGSRRRTGNRMIRRGMEMLVGGVPINADPPQRCVDLIYRPLEQVGDWSRVITLNSRDFGPLLDSSTAHLVTEQERGLFCEYFVQAAMKWDVCPKYLKDIVKQHCMGKAMTNALPKQTTTTTPTTANNNLNNKQSLFKDRVSKSIKANKDEGNEENILSLMRLVDDEEDRFPASQAINGKQPKQGRRTTVRDDASEKLTADQENQQESKEQDDDTLFRFGGDLVFDIGVSRDELESGTGGGNGGIVRQVLARGISAAIDHELKGFLVHIASLVMTDKEDGTTSISAEFGLHPEEPMTYQQAKQRYQRVKAALAQAMDDGDMQLALAAAAREETGWPENIRDRVVEEFLFEEDEVPYEDEQERNEDGSRQENTQNEDLQSTQRDERANDDDDDDINESREGMSNDDLFIGGGDDGVFFDYSEGNILNAPFQGELGPRLVEAVMERTKERRPRVIAIGDVHGCIDELQDLLRQCDYQPGDLVIFLGDMVSKGPDSTSVVQMAREIGAIGVRGNHDFEVIRWHQAIKSGVDPPVVGSEHFHVASCLSKADMKWLYSLPWYISSKELGALFVHAGFVSGIRLAKQNPRLMMNMRSILPDGTVTSKFFNNWPWARLWDGPQTVLFGHDADRGLQQYEHAIGLDTGCVYGGRLTACLLPEKRLVSVSAKREYFKYRRKHYD